MDLTVCIVRRSCFVQSLFRSSTSRMIMLANLSVVPLCGRKGFTGLQEIDDRLDLVEILAAPADRITTRIDPALKKKALKIFDRLGLSGACRKKRDRPHTYHTHGALFSRRCYLRSC